MAQYQRLDLMEREELSRMLAAGHSLEQWLKRYSEPSTLSRELTRHRTRRPRIERAGSSTGAALGSPAAQASKVGGAALALRAHRGLRQMRTARSGILTTDDAHLAEAIYTICMCASGA